MNILLTGSRGFIGSHLKDHLVSRHRVTHYDLKDGDDIRDKRKLDHLFETERFDCVIHCAALTGVRRGERYPEEYLSTNVMGTKNIVDFVEQYHVPYLVNFSSSSVYGADTKEPLTEESPKAPKSVYGMTKLMAEQLVERLQAPWCTVRPFTVYGSNGRGDQVIQKWLNLALEGKPLILYGDGSAGRGFTNVLDLVSGIDLILERKPTGTFNLGGDTLVTLKQVRRIFEAQFPDLKVEFYPVQEGDPKYNLADTTKARKTLGWKPTRKFQKEVHDIITHVLPQES